MLQNSILARNFFGIFSIFFVKILILIFFFSVEKPITESAKKRFHCSDCDASFARKAYLNKHQKTKHGDQNGDGGKMNLTFPLEAKGKEDIFLSSHPALKILLIDTLQNNVFCFNVNILP